MRIAVGAITRRRPQMFADLLASFAAMERPAGAEVIFVFAENDAGQTIGPQVDAFRARVPEEVLLGLETRPGIPFARNRVLDMAREAGADILTFVDDDERVRRDWLVALVAGLERRGLDLAGGPVQPVAADGRAGPAGRAVLAHLRARAERRNRTRAGAVRDGSDGALNLYTNNWALRLATQARLGLRFDEALAVSGGSDTAFSIALRAVGGRSGWIPQAVVEEPVPPQRLTLAYHYARARDQATNAVVLSGKSRGKALAQAFARLLEALLGLPALPVTRGRGLARIVHKLGMADGLARGAFGRRSAHYAASAARYHAETEG
jgi:GT2 family glycosyltransferase